MKYSKYLEKLANGEGIYRKYLGLCDSFKRKFEISLYSTMSSKDISFEGWPEFSGCSKYPVPGYEKQDPVDAYLHAADNMYCTSTHYGRSRRRLAMWLSEQFAAKGM